jgi:hypothetical protein
MTEKKDRPSFDLYPLPGKPSDPPTWEDIDRAEAKAMSRAKALCALPASRFSVNELVLIARIGWSSFRTNYYAAEWPMLEKLAKREGVDEQAEP